MEDELLIEKKNKYKGHFYETLFGGVIAVVICIVCSIFMESPKDIDIVGVLFVFFMFCNSLGAWIYWAILIGNYIVYDNPEIKPIYVGCISIPSGILLHYVTGPYVYRLMHILFNDYPPYDGIWRELIN